MKKFSAITLAEFQAMSIPGGKMLVVDGTNGSDTKGLRGSSLRAYATLTAAKNAAQSGDTIVVMPGTYTERDLLKNGVNWHFMAGALVINDLAAINERTQTLVGVCQIFTDKNQPVVCNITGDGDFEVLLGNGSIIDIGGGVFALNDRPAEITDSLVIRASNAATKINFHFNKISYSGYIGIADSFLIGSISGATLNLFGNEIITENTSPIGPVIGYEDPPSNTLPITAPDNLYMYWWQYGESVVNVKRIKAWSFCIYLQGDTNSSANNLWFTAELLHTRVTGAACVFGLGDSGANKRTWLNVTEIKSDDGPALTLNLSGRIYVNANKIGTGSSGYSAIEIPGNNGATTPLLELWIKANKISGTSRGIDVVLNTNAQRKIYLQCDHFEGLASAASATSFVRVNGSASVLYMNGGVARMKQNCAFVEHLAGISNIRQVRVETNETNDADNKPAIAGGAGLVLDNCTLVAPALADSVYAASAQTVKVYGTTFTNKAKNANVTIQVGTLTVDANVS